jgi:hypothetical protein
MRDPVEIPVKSFKQRIGQTQTDDTRGVMFFARHRFFFPGMALLLSLNSTVLQDEHVCMIYGIGNV